MACGQASISIDNGMETSPLLMLATGGRGAVPRRNGSVVAQDAMENTKHNLSRFLLKTAQLMESRGCRTVGELLESGSLPDDPTERAKTILQILRNLDYIALRFLVSVIEDPELLMDDDSLL